MKTKTKKIVALTFGWISLFTFLSYLCVKEMMREHSAFELLFYFPVSGFDAGILNQLLFWGNTWILSALVGSLLYTSFTEENSWELIRRKKKNMFCHALIRVMGVFLCAVCYQVFLCWMLDLYHGIPVAGWKIFQFLGCVYIGGLFQVLCMSLFSFYFKYMYCLLIQTGVYVCQIILILLLQKEDLWFIPLAGMAYNMQMLLYDEKQILLWIVTVIILDVVLGRFLAEFSMRAEICRK